MAVSDETLQPALPPSLPPGLLVVCHACCDFDPGMRPDFSVVVEMLGAAIREMRHTVGGRARRGRARAQARLRARMRGRTAA